MPLLSEAGQNVVRQMAQKHGVSEDAAAHMLMAIQNGNGTMAQFNHPEFGGSGQWMRGGMTMVSDLFNNQLKYRVDGICNDLSNEILNNQLTPYAASSQSQSQSGGYNHQTQANGVGFGQNNLFAPDPNANWWPQDLGSPSATGSQNNVSYAYFSYARRLAVKTGRDVWVYNTLDHNIGGFGQQQGVGGSITFSSQYGTVNLSTLPVVSRNGVTQENPAPAASQPSMSYSNFSASNSSTSPDVSNGNNVFDSLERLGALRDKGYISDQEFNTKKAELLSRL